MEIHFNSGKRQEEADKKIITPVRFVDNKTLINPVYYPEDHPNDARRFAILKTTENGKYVKSGMLVFRVNGVELYTDLNNALFIDLNNNTVFIKDYEKVLNEISPEDPEKRQYILLMTCDGDNYVWEAMTGRSTAYQYIVDNIDSMSILPDKSFILTENVPYKDSITMTAFIRYLKNGNLVDDDGFDIEEYVDQN